MQGKRETIAERGGFQDRVGIGFRPELAEEMLAHRDAIDVFEVIVDPFFFRPRREIRELRRQLEGTPVFAHGVSLGMASSHPTDRRRLDAMARVVGDLAPESWSEHMSFVRAGGVEIGHLSAPPRTAATIDATVANIARATRVVGAAPALENIATLIEPPASTMDELSFVHGILDGTGAPLLLDLHNLHANALNFGYAPSLLLERVSTMKVTAIHVAGGRVLPAPNGEERILDDHLHDVPTPVYRLLEEVAASVAAPLTVIIERDGKYPPFASLLDELAKVRTAIANGRAMGVDRGWLPA